MTTLRGGLLAVLAMTVPVVTSTADNVGNVDNVDDAAGDAADRILPRACDVGDLGQVREMLAYANQGFRPPGLRDRHCFR